MIEFLTTSSTASRVEAVIRKAERDVVLVSPYLQFSANFAQRLRDADQRGVRITIIYGKENLQKAAREVLRDLAHLSLYYCDNLHAKCYFNESAMVITSMNLYEYSEKNNREMGVWVTDDEAVYREALEETKSIISISEKQELPNSKRSVVEALLGNPNASRSKSNGRKRTGGKKKRRRKKKGYCIRCKTRITQKPSAPYCKECYGSWAKWENPAYEEKYCHTCGSDITSSMEKPECYTCYSSA